MPSPQHDMSNSLLQFTFPLNSYYFIYVSKVSVKKCTDILVQAMGQISNQLIGSASSNIITTFQVPIFVSNGIQIFVSQKDMTMIISHPQSLRHRINLTQYISENQVVLVFLNRIEAKHVLGQSLFLWTIYYGHTVY